MLFERYHGILINIFWTFKIQDMTGRKYVNPFDAIADLQDRGYEHDFILMGNQLYCAQQKLLLRVGDFEIFEMYYFPGNGPGHYERMVYGIGTGDHGIKGILMTKGVGNTGAFPNVINNILRKGFVQNRPAAARSIL